MDQKIKHLEFIQEVINRLSTNSFLLKGWSVVLVSALFALSAHNSSGKFILLSFLPAIIFWGLDGYFLNLERKYRILYDKVREKDPKEIDFSMSIKGIEFGFGSWVKATFSRSLIPFHGVLILSIILVMIIKI